MPTDRIMKHTKRIVVVAASLLAVAGESDGQSVYERASLEAHRWEVLSAKESAALARGWLDETKKEFEGYQKNFPNEVSLQVREFLKNHEEQQKTLEEYQKILPNEAPESIRELPDEASLESMSREVVERRLSMIEAKLIAAQASLSATEAQIVTTEAVFAAVQASSEEDFLVATAAHGPVYKAVILILEKLGEISEIWEEHRKIKAGPTSNRLAIVWANAALAARAAERAEAIVEALNSGGPLPPELLEPLPTEFRTLA